ncbi:MAG: ABC transporter ATP-binding protein [Candidatus Saccharibacteria bacterium]|nr:ABC transporter ATP-binding protein [Pseudorhodobacter sp.]
MLDEPRAALDVSIQAQVLNLLRELRTTLGLTMLFIAHELGVVRYVSDRVAVMYRGAIMEIGTSAEIFEMPQHPYTKSLLAAKPRLLPEKRSRAPRADQRGRWHNRSGLPLSRPLPPVRPDMQHGNLDRETVRNPFCRLPLCHPPPPLTDMKTAHVRYLRGAWFDHLDRQRAFGEKRRYRGERGAASAENTRPRLARGRTTAADPPRYPAGGPHA